MIDIVIPNYNGNKYLKECIDSLYTQTYSNFRIIIIDNGSTDSDYKWLNKYKNLIFKKLDKNYGFDKAVNEGIKLSDSKYIVLLNNDTVAKENWLEELIKCIDSDKKIFSVCSKMLRYDDKNLIDDAGDEYNILGWGYKRGDGQPINEYNKTDVNRGFRFFLAHVFNYTLQMFLLNIYIKIGINQNIAPIFVFIVSVPVNFIFVKYALKNK